MPLDVFDRLLRPLRRGSVTSHYPDEPALLSPATRGLPELDAVRCEGTAVCVVACPTQAISVAGLNWSIDAGACVFCGACARACPTNAILLGQQVELAARERAALTIVRERRTEP